MFYQKIEINVSEIIFTFNTIMIDRWRALSTNSRYSIIAFLIVFASGLVSMGVLGILLYYSVCFFLTVYPSLNQWHGDWVWPATIGVGMLWSFGFLFSGFANHFIGRFTQSKIVYYLVYFLILYLWALCLWAIVLLCNSNGLH